MSVNSASDKILDKILSYTEMAEKFVASEAPQYVKEYLEYEAWYHQMWLYWGFVPFLLVLLVFIILCLRKSNSDDEIMVSGVSLISMLLLAFAIVPHSYMRLKKIEKAPRIYILENLKGK